VWLRSPHSAQPVAAVNSTGTLSMVREVLSEGVRWLCRGPAAMAFALGMRCCRPKAFDKLTVCCDAAGLRSGDKLVPVGLVITGRLHRPPALYKVVQGCRY